MIHTPDYTIALKDGTEIPLLFTTRFYRKYSALKGLEFDDLYQKIQNTLPTKDDDGNLVHTDGAKFSSLELPDIMLLAHRNYCEYNKIPCTYTDLDSDAWLDDMGGVFFAAEKNGDIFSLFVAKLLNLDAAQFEVETAEKGDKKKEVSASAGTVSSDRPLQPA